MAIAAAALGLACATPIEIPGADGGRGFDAGASFGDAAEGVGDRGAAAPDVFNFNDGFDGTGVGEMPVSFAQNADLSGVTALYADGEGLYIAAGAELWHWAPDAGGPVAHSTLPAPIVQIAAVSAGPRLYLVTESGVLSVPRAPGQADVRTHYTPAAASFSGAIAVSATALFVVDPVARQVLRQGFAAAAPAPPAVLYESPNAQVATLSAALAADGEQVYFADADGPLRADGAGSPQRLGDKRSGYRWSGVVVGGADALLVAQAGDLGEGLMRIALPGGAEEAVVWIGGANNNAGLVGPVLLGQLMIWGAAAGIYRTDLRTDVTVRIAPFSGLIAGDGAHTLYLYSSQDRRLYRAELSQP